MPPVSPCLRLERAFVLACMLLPGALGAQAPGALDGFYDLRLPNPDGSFRHTYFELHSDGSNITGKLFGRNVGGQPLAGTITAGKLHFATIPPPLKAGSPAAIGSTVTPIVYDGTFANGRLTLEFHRYNGGSVTGDAIPTSRDVAVPPAPLPLPAPRDLPDNGLVRTPPMGWNSWNKFAGRITDADVRSMADAMVATGMKAAGYQYINIDDTWEAEDRAPDGTILTNKKFPDMKALADYVHARGLKIGIYSSPGPRTCAAYLGSFGHEAQDANTYAAWGIDYLKYDLCGARAVYESTYDNERGLYQKMGEALAATGRPIVYSLCQYGDDDVWKWGTKVGGNLWRTTGDIRDTWDSMDKIGFGQVAISSYTRPGHWNDPDMLEVGNGGMTADEYRTHMSLWAMLAAPLIAGNDLRTMTPETASILLNKDVIAIDQDRAAKPTQTLTTSGKMETLWRPLADGSITVGIFNRGDSPTPAALPWSTLPGGFGSKKPQVQDLWKHQAVATTGTAYTATIPAHGVALLRITAAR